MVFCQGLASPVEGAIPRVVAATNVMVYFDRSSNTSLGCVGCAVVVLDKVGNVALWVSSSFG